jgi:hypothetical protein
MSDAKLKAKRERVQATIRGASGEPFIDPENYRISLMRALNWYTANEDEKKIFEYASTFVKTTPDLKAFAPYIRHANYMDVKPIGVIARLLSREQYVSEEHVARVRTMLERIKRSHVEPKEEAKEEAPAVVAPSIQDRILESARRFASEVDAQIDEYVTTKSNDFSMKAYLSSSSISGPVAKKIGELYKPLSEEIGIAIQGSDSQVKEGWSFLTKPQLKKLSMFVQGIIDACNQQVVSAKAQRKPRARKEKPASVIVAKMKYMKEFADLKLKSVNPTSIVGASELWVYTPDKRKLTVYRAANNGTLSVSGMSILNYDLASSEVKTLRKPEEFFKGLSSTGKRALANAWKAVKSKTTSPRSRINEDMILLATN